MKDVETNKIFEKIIALGDIPRGILKYHSDLSIVDDEFQIIFSDVYDYIVATRGRQYFSS
jgi:hypothetical protein